jgi:hypothetical protein
VSFVRVLKIIGPAVLSAIPATKKYAPLIIEGIATAEELAENDPVQKPNKKEIAKQMVSITTELTNKISKTDSYDPGEAVEIADSSIDIVVKAVNEYRRK